MRAIALVMLAACNAASPSPGLDAVLEVPRAQYRPGAFPADDGGPAALALSTQHAAVKIGRTDERMFGTLAPDARTAVIGAEGYDGAWILPAGPPDVAAPDSPTANTTFALREGVEPGPLTLLVAAGGADGRIGAPASADVVAEPVDPPAGDLVIRLVWDSAADLDLHVVDPLGGEAWADKPNTAPLPMTGVPTDPTDFLKHGILDHDGNKDCHRDGGAPNEDVVWSMPAPAGDYVVKVDARAMCGAAEAVWYVAVYRGGDVIAAARGISVPADVLPDPDASIPLSRAGLGTLALRFSL